MAQDWDPGHVPGQAHVVITAADEVAAYRVFDALVDRFPGTDPPIGHHVERDRVELSVLTQTLDPAASPPPGPERPARLPGQRPAPCAAPGPAAFGPAVSGPSPSHRPSRADPPSAAPADPAPAPRSSGGSAPPGPPPRRPSPRWPTP